MKKKNIIILSILINMGLVIILFATAVSPKNINKETKNKNSTLEISKIEKIIDDADNSVISMPVVDKSKSENFVKVVVKNGDTLGAISQANGSTVEEIMKLNNLKTHEIVVGQTLKIPFYEKNEKIVMVEKEQEKEKKFYSVMHGDSPWSIAKKHGLKLKEFLELNNLDEYSARKLKVNQKVRVG